MGIFHTEYCMDPRWQNLWTWLSIFLLGPAAFLAGFSVGGGFGVYTLSIDEMESGGHSNTGGSSGISAGNTYRTSFFMKSPQILRSSDPSICLQGTPEKVARTVDVNLATPITVCLDLEQNGNLVLYQWFEDKDQQQDISSVLWSSQVNAREDDYWVRLQGDGNLVVSRGAPKENDDDLDEASMGHTTSERSRDIVWDSKSASVSHKDYLLTLNDSATGLQIVRSSGIEGSALQVYWSSKTNTFSPPSQAPSEPLQPSILSPTTPNQPTPTSFESNSPVGGFYPFAFPSSPPQNPTFVEPPALPPPQQDFESDYDYNVGTELQWSKAPWSSQYQLLSGPLVGHVTDRTARIWAMQGQGIPMEMIYARVGDRNARLLNMPPNADQGAAILEIVDLQSNTAYQYEIRIDGERIGEGSFKTAPTLGQPTQFQFLLASCIDVKGNKYPSQPVWNSVLAAEPDFAMLNGDTVYLNDQDWTQNDREIILERVWARNLDQRAESYYQNFISKVPTYSTWDDHEYGTNNSDKNQKGKYNSLRAFSHLWPNPSFGTSSIEGVFYSFYWGDVHFIVCDNRWYRDRNLGTQWGSEQKEWIYDQLRNSRSSSFKIIVSGGDVMERGFSKDVDDLGKVISRERISGVIFCAGDIHRNEYKEMDNGNWPYKIRQITSSGIAREWRRPWAIVKLDTTQQNPELSAHFYGAEDQRDDTTWTNDPSIQCSAIQGVNRYNEHKCTEVIRLSDVTV